MFSGLIHFQGTLAGRDPDGGHRLNIDCPGLDPVTGGSVAVNGVCLTATAALPGRFAADLSPETLAITTLGALPVGRRLNLELPLTPATLLDGHLVCGHVDGIGVVRSRDDLDAARRLWFDAPQALLPLVAPKGSIAIDGVSLTVNEVDAGGFCVMLIPHTLKNTTLSDLVAGDRVNLEVDPIARYVARRLSFPVEP